VFRRNCDSFTSSGSSGCFGNRVFTKPLVNINPERIRFDFCLATGCAKMTPEELLKLKLRVLLSNDYGRLSPFTKL